MDTPEIDDDGRALLDEIAAVAADVRDRVARVDEERRYRDALIVEAVNAGIRYADIAAAAQIAKSRICGILLG